MKPSSDTVRSWIPDLINRPGSRGLAVPYRGRQPMSRALYEHLAEKYLQSLIQRNPDQARQVLSSSPELLPDLYEIANLGEVMDWPAQIVACGQMQMLLDQMNWQKGSLVNLSPSDLPTLEQFSEALTT